MTVHYDQGRDGVSSACRSSAWARDKGGAEQSDARRLRTRPQPTYPTHADADVSWPIAGDRACRSTRVPPMPPIQGQICRNAVRCRGQRVYAPTRWRRCYQRENRRQIMQTPPPMTANTRPCRVCLCHVWRED